MAGEIRLPRFSGRLYLRGIWQRVGKTLMDYFLLGMFTCTRVQHTHGRFPPTHTHTHEHVSTHTQMEKVVHRSMCGVDRVWSMSPSAAPVIVAAD